MTVTAETLRRLSTLLDQALELPPGARAAWIDALDLDDAALGHTLRALLAQAAASETGDILGRGLAFTAPSDRADAVELRAGDIVGPYRLVRLLGRGGMGEVWLAERIDGVLKRPVALKLPMLGMRRSALVQRFARERDILAALTHPHIARLYDAGVAADGQPYLALEFVEGKPVTDYCRERSLGIRSRVTLLRQVLDAVQYAHANLVIHRDLKPSNVLVTPDGRAMLLDFGIAKLLDDEQGGGQETELTRLGGRALTPDYAAPEQIAGAPVSIATDVYVLGLLAYELLAGSRPFPAATRGDLERAVLSADPVRPSQVSGGVLAKATRTSASDVDAIVLKALKKAPQERYATVNAFADDLDRWLAGEPVFAQHDSMWYRTRKFAGRHRVGIAGGATLALALVAATLFSAWQASIARREARTAEAVESFMRDVFAANTGAQADPAAARNTTARELLDRGAQRVDAALADTPEARARVLETLADMYGELALYRQTLELRRKQVALLRETESASSARLAKAIGEEAQAALAANEAAEAQRGFAEALAILDRRGDDASFERGVIESSIAQLHIVQGTDGLEHARRAVAILRRHPPSQSLLWALHRFAYLASDQGELAASVAAVREGLAIAPGLGDQGLEPVSRLHFSLGQLQSEQYHLAEAEASLRRAWEEASRRHGPNSLQAIGAASGAGRILYEHGLYRQARTVFEAVAAAAEQWMATGDRTYVSALAIGQRGAARAMTGSVEEGIADLQRALAVREAMDANPRVALILQQLLADAWIQRGDYARAAEVLDASEASVTKQARANPQAVGRQRLARLHVAQATGDRDEIRRRLLASKLDQPGEYEGRPVIASREHPDGTARRLADLCEARLTAGDADGALGDALRVLEIARTSANAAFHRDRERRASLVAGKALVEKGAPAQAIDHLRRSVALGQDPLDIAATLAHADALTALATALADAGMRDEALQRMREAEAIHARYQRVPQHYRKPFATLEERLRAPPPQRLPARS